MTKKSPSKLGKAIEEALDMHPLVRPYSFDNKKKYAVLYRGPNGAPFAAERITQSHIRIWIGSDPRLKLKVETAGFDCGENPYSGDPKAPGWLSTLMSIPEFNGVSKVYWSKAASVSDAVKIVEALN